MTLEARAPRRTRTQTPRARWSNNLAIAALNALAVRLVFPAAAIGAALWAQAEGVGLFNVIETPGWAAILIAFVVLDLAVYAQHVLMHVAPPLWRLHRMHHADLDIDVTTGVRFHPLEILVSMAWKMAVVVALGAPAAAVFAFEIALNASSLFNHANLKLPAPLDRALRLVIVTPDMHRVHHSVERCETDSNFGFTLSLWDRLFGAYRAQPAAGHDAMTIGLPIFRDARETRFDRLLSQPFR
ncbi:MAG: sterol desaturase family protein [Alphaproteobacteria bacterium]|nr:sterol desaturase family protein [Alphaproteobacteria bacterium]